MTVNRKVDIGIWIFTLAAIIGMAIPGYQIWDTLPYGVKKLVIGLWVALASVIVIAVEDFVAGRIGRIGNTAIFVLLASICVVTWAVVFDLSSAMMR